MARRGFTLVEVAVAIGVLGILAGAMAPMALRALNRHRAEVTRRQLEAAFEAMFGSRERRVANMRADFGFNPARSYGALPFLVRNAWDPALPAFGTHDGASFPWGYNGPYWLGPVVAGLPVDGWGHPIRLDFDPRRGGTWQLRSLGPDQQEGADDLLYPPVPASVGAYSATVLVVVTRVGENLKGTVTLRWAEAKAGLASRSWQLDAAKPAQSFTCSVPAGGMELVFTPEAGAFTPFVLPMDLLPGVTRTVEVKL